MRYNKKGSTNTSAFKPQSIRLLDQVAEVMRYHHYSKRSEEAYVRWIKQFVLRGFQSPVRHRLIMQLNTWHRKPHLVFYS